MVCPIELVLYRRAYVFNARIRVEGGKEHKVSTNLELNRGHLVASAAEYSRVTNSKGDCSYCETNESTVDNTVSLCTDQISFRVEFTAFWPGTARHRKLQPVLEQ